MGKSRNLFLSYLIGLVAACNPPVEKIYEKSFPLRAARELDAIGDTGSARYYLDRALEEQQSRAEALNFLSKIVERKTHSADCIESKKTDLTINQYPRIRHKHLFQLAVCLEAAGETAKALNSYNLSENAGSKQPQLYIRRALLEERVGDKTAARRDFMRATELNAGYMPGQLAYALFLIRGGEGAGKIKDLLRKGKPAYADIVEDAEKDRAALLKSFAAQEAKTGSK